MSGSHPVYGTNSLLTVLLVLVEKILIQHPPGNAKINYKINPKMVYSVWEEKYIANHILYPGIQVILQCQQQTGHWFQRADIPCDTEVIWAKSTFIPGPSNTGKCP